MSNLIQIKSSVTAETENDSPTFADFWLMYPRRVARKEAEKCWTNMSAAHRVAAITGLVGWRKVWIARGELEFVPHAATWLRGERWDDELPTTLATNTGALCHQTANLPSPTERVAMPDHVRALLAKLRGK